MKMIIGGAFQGKTALAMEKNIRILNGLNGADADWNSIQERQREF